MKYWKEKGGELCHKLAIMQSKPVHWKASREEGERKMSKVKH